jgi:hypothetical protein
VQLSFDARRNIYSREQHESERDDMALIDRFEKKHDGPWRVHDGVVCGYRIGHPEGRRILQLESYGSSSRKNPDTVSQSFQLDREMAGELRRIIDAAFPPT